MGDCKLDSAVLALLGAGREAAINAAKWSEAQSVSIYIEVERERITMFVRDLGRGFIHVHHLKPLSEIQEEYEIDPIADLRPICPNCHAMIHCNTEMMSIKDLKKLIQSSDRQPEV